jgi:MOSC domain-containing protein
MTVVGKIESLWRYPVKSMAGETVDEVFVGYAGVFGDRLYAFLNQRAPAGFPYLTGRTRPEMLRFSARFRDAARASQPANRADAEGMGPGLTPVYPHPDDLVVDVTLPSGERLAATDPLLVERLAGRGADVSDLSLIRSDRALTDCRPVSLISHHTIKQIGDEIGLTLDRRRFRANIFADLGSGHGFGEDTYVGKRLQLGARCVIAVLDRDPRCKMISIDPETSEENKDVFGHVSRAHDGCAGIYCAVLTEGMVRKGDAIVMVD